jgi:hypothetical protein
VEWRRILEEHRVPYKDSGPSTKRDNIYIECPWCRDGSQHLGMAETAPFRWGCWKDTSHRGRRPQRLLMTLLRVDFDTATRIAGLDVSRADLSELTTMLAGLGVVSKFDPAPLLEYPRPPGVFALRPKGKRSQRFLRYLEQRGLPRDCASRYRLQGSDHPASEWRDRLCLPICSPAGLQVGLTGRHVGKHPQRYHTLPSSSPNACLFNAEHATGGRVLALCEGPLDALTLDWAAHTGHLEASSIAMMGLTLGHGQVDMLTALASRYRAVVLIPDPSALAQGLALQRQLPLDISVAQLPEGVGDPGDLTPRQAHTFMKTLVDDLDSTN